MRFRVTLLSFVCFTVWGCSPEEIVEASAPIYEIGVQEVWIPLPDGVRLDDLTPEQRAQAEEIVKEMAAARDRLLQAPASTVVANHAMGLYELAALHLSQQEPNFSEATLAIDSLAAIVDGLGPRLDDAETTLREGLDQLRMVFVQLRNQSGSDPT